MDTVLLATKLRVPPNQQRAVHRARLIDMLEGGIPHHKLTLIAAPAGYGKTTLLAHWAHTSQIPVAWLSIGAEDNDGERFFRYLLRAWDEVQPGVRFSPLGLLLGAMLPDRHAVLLAFLNAAAEVSDHLVFVLDDYHLIEEPSIHQALAFLLDHLPPMLHFVLAGRAAPPLPLARYRARRELMELHAPALCFTPDETADFLEHQVGAPLTRDQIATLDTHLEGWIAGWQLVALTLQQQLAQADKLALTGKNRFVADYLHEDVLAPLPPTLRQFLLQTSILDRLCGPLCNAITGGDDGQALLERLERDNLFIQPLDDSREWFRYHPLFADVLRVELHRQHPDQLNDLHRRAARWHLAHELPEPALRHAIAGTDAETAVEVFDSYVNVKLNSGELQLVKRWLEALPEHWRARYPVFAIAQAGLLAFTGALDACIQCIDELERRLTRLGDAQAHGQLGKVCAVRCAIACMQDDLRQAELYADQALRALKPDDNSFLGIVFGSLGDAHRRQGHWQEAQRWYHKLLDLPLTPTYRFLSVHVFGALADLALLQGRLRDAAANWNRALAGFEDEVNWGGYPLPVIGWVYNRMGETLYEWNQLDAAKEYLAQGLQRAELGGDVRTLIAGYLLAGRLNLTEGNPAASAEYVERARALFENAAFPDWIGRFERLQLECWIAQNRLRAAVQWADQRVKGAADGSYGEELQLAVARVLIVKGDASSVERAHDLLQGLLGVSETTGRMALQIEALALHALAYERHGDHAGALTCLERALRLAEPEGYVRRFVDLGLPMARLLQTARSRGVMPDYLARLLAAFEPFPDTPVSSTSLPEPLTEREREIVEMIAAGLTNREIAEALVISPETVKKHTSSIFGKLGVANRTEAATRARELNLLP